MGVAQGQSSRQDTEVVPPHGSRPALAVIADPGGAYLSQPTLAGSDSFTYLARVGNQRKSDFLADQRYVRIPSTTGPSTGSVSACPECQTTAASALSGAPHALPQSPTHYPGCRWFACVQQRQTTITGCTKTLAAENRSSSGV